MASPILGDAFIFAQASYFSSKNKNNYYAVDF
jgi:hypothetical protein